METLKRDRSPLRDGIALLICGVLAGVLAAAAAFPLVGLGGLVAENSVNSFESLPTELTKPTLPQTTYVYASDGETLITSFYEENRREVSLDEVSPVMIDALLAAEDSKFYEHNGVDWAGIIRAAVANQGGDSQGASTLTMQFVRNTLIYSASTIDEVIAASEDTYERKLREARYAMGIEETMSKEDILEGYLNVIYLGNQAYGVHAGSYTYFNKSPSELTAAEAATLASLPKFPSLADGLLDGEGDDQAIVDRRNWILDRMVGLGKLEQAEADEAKELPLGLNPRPVRSECVDVATPNWGFFCDYFKEWWTSQEAFGETERDRMSLLKRGGFKIVTSLDAKLQDQATERLTEEVSVNNSAALGSVTITPGTGHVRAMAVNRNYSLDQTENKPRTDGDDSKPSNYPNTTIPLLSGNDEVSGYPAGSTFKMFTMVAALDAGFPLRTALPSPGRLTSQYLTAASDPSACGSTTENDQRHWCPSNDGGWSSGPMNMWAMFGRSSNTAFVQLQQAVGTKKAYEAAVASGIDFAPDSTATQHAESDSLNDYGTFTLGFDATTPLEMAEAYATVAAEGLHCEPLPVMQVFGADGAELPDAAAPQCDQAFPKEVANAAVSAGRCVVGQSPEGTRCSGNGTAASYTGNFDRPLFGKTGTADSDRSYWFIGSTPNATTATFVGDPDASFRSNVATADLKVSVKEVGVSILKSAVKDLPEEDWSKPTNAMINGKNLVSIPSIDCMDADDARSRVANAGFDASIAAGTFDSDCKEGEAFSTSMTGSAPSGSPIYILVSNGKDYKEDEPTDGATPPDASTPPDDRD
ncbi:transglycosylase domain-containing protein [Glycomyces algeriensis]|uniref:Transglycosylase n=1 Tax=Glycomyces algeriensis TaxID=256037 RepID=A0A9W6G5H4_9ACTN|nr:transglycosylase domain-containing protein [Glycomyces algeriensis]MDA1368500.1 transglycosylase domain-containing protein [Glycomyces algeriensis]MDR7348763.1 membrane peptidoglycan carboxypeptidase [Glycomyces algeriensis]GLI41465.1 transglycosylase [Glycomyces algeriensis]